MRARTRVFIGAVLFSWVLALVVAAAGAGPATVDSGPQYRSEATAAAHAWLTGEPVQLTASPGLERFGRVVGERPGEDSLNPVRGIAAIDFEMLVWVDAERFEVSEFLVYETHTFLVGLADGRSWHLDVVILETPTGPVLAHAPSLSVPRLAETPRNPGFGWGPEYATFDLPRPAVDQIEVWAQAWASDDRRGLYALTRDTEPRVYRGLGGFEVRNVMVLSAARLEDGARSLARVRVELASIDDPSLIVLNDHDLLLSRVNEPMPAIEAWGPAGSGRTLVAYGNGEEPGDFQTPTTRPPQTTSTTVDLPAPNSPTTTSSTTTTTTTEPPASEGDAGDEATAMEEQP